MAQPARSARPGPVRRAAAGAAAGTVATAAMTGVILAGIAGGAMPDLPPRHVIDRVLPGLPEPAAAASTLMSHLAYGAAAGALLAAAIRVTPARGVAFGAVLWALGYEGWVPAIGALPPAHRDRRGRVLTMVAAHLVYGAVLGRRIGSAARG